NSTPKHASTSGNGAGANGGANPSPAAPDAQIRNSVNDTAVSPSLRQSAMKGVREASAGAGSSPAKADPEIFVSPRAPDDPSPPVPEQPAVQGRPGPRSQRLN